jgi:predicted ATPase/DNA-binding CsgD family transcriptional regulator/transcriptional regulator with XRE-family HTH domain
MQTQPSVAFGTLLRYYRLRIGLTQEALAEHAGLTPAAISALERGERRQPYPQTLDALARALELDADQRDLFVQVARAKQGPLATEPPADVPAIVQRLSNARGTRARHAALPIAPNPLIGRADEYATIARAVTNSTCRLVTLVGPGGVGKTRLALQVATTLAAEFADGVAWVSLAPVAAADHIAAAIADALQVPLHGAESPADQVLDALRDRTMLLVLDNMEHLLEATSLLATMLEQAPSVRLLVTSRERLRVGGEWVIDVPGLALPPVGPSTRLVQVAAVQLFTQRAQQVAHAFVVTDANGAAIARICHLLEGMPLGIELAAAWMGTLSPTQIAEEIARNLDFLALADRTAPPRHRSLRAVFDHSWSLLTADERQVFARLAVFRGGCTRAAAEDIAGASLPVLAALVDKSLIRRIDDATDMPRYELHELLRQYALAKLQDNPDAEARTRDRHCAYYARQLGERTGAFRCGAANLAMAEVAPDLDNLRQAWAWAVQQRDHGALEQMGPSLQVICEVRGLFEEGVVLFREAVGALRATLGGAPTSAAGHNPELVWTLGHMLSLYGNRAARCGRFEEARDRLHEAYALLEARGDLLVGTGTLAWLGYMTYVLGEYAEARAWFTRSIELARAYGDTFFLARSESMLALVAQAQGVGDEAVTLAHTGVRDWRANGHPCSLAMGLWALSNILHGQGESTQAEAAAREGLQLGAWLQDPWSTGSALLQLGTIALARGETATAHDLVEESLTIFGELGDPWSQGRALVARGWVAEAAGNTAEARAAFEQACDIGRATQLDPIRLNAQYGLASLMRADAPSAALALLEQIIAHPATEATTRTRALQLRTHLLPADGSMAGTTQHDVAGVRVTTTGETLTPREVEVLRLLAQGCSNQVIAEDLVVAVGTVKRHVNSIFGKLAVQSRLEAVTRARDLDLLHDPALPPVRER